MNGQDHPGGIGNGAVQNTGRVAATASTATANAALSAAQRKALKERAADRYCPECGTEVQGEVDACPECGAGYQWE